MIGKLIGAVAGAQAAKHSRNLGGPGGAILGAVAVPIVRRMKFLPLLAIGGGAYLVKKMADKGNAASRSGGSSSGRP